LTSFTSEEEPFIASAEDVDLVREMRSTVLDPNRTGCFYKSKRLIQEVKRP